MWAEEEKKREKEWKNWTRENERGCQAGRKEIKEWREKYKGSKKGKKEGRREKRSKFY